MTYEIGGHALHVLELLEGCILLGNGLAGRLQGSTCP